MKGIIAPQRTQTVAVDDVSFDIAEGELVGYLGPNGAGKSTTIKMLTGILQPTSGQIRIDGIDPQRDRKEVTRRIGVVFGQKTQLWWDLPVYESFDLLRAIYRIPGPEFKRRLDFLVELLRMSEFLHQQARKVSLGQRMRADLAAALLHKPKVLFLDEPTIGLDILTRDTIREFIKELNRTDRTTILLTTHDMQDIEYLANRLILLDNGRVHHDGQLGDFLARYAAKRVVAVHLEEPCEASVFRDGGFDVQAQHSPFQFDIVSGADEGIAPLIDLVARAGNRLKEITVRRQDLADTLKLLYRGERNLEL